MMFSTSSTLIAAAGQHAEDVRQHAGPVSMPDREHVCCRAAGETVDDVRDFARCLKRLHDPDHLVGDGHLRLLGGRAHMVGAVHAGHLNDIGGEVGERRPAGSFWKTSSPARIPFSSTARFNAASSTTEPREVLMRYAPGRIAARNSAPTRCFVSALAATLIETASDSRATSSGVCAYTTPRRSASSCVRLRDQATTRMPKALARAAISRPICPSPTMPSVRP